jgi:hypothetical protein
MKALSLAFVAVLLLAHATGDSAKMLPLPLSMLREDAPASLGYGLFALLLLAGGLMILALRRAERHDHVCLFCLLACLLVLVALTPSEGAFHLLCSLVLLAVLYGYYGVLLRAAGGWWLWVHLAAPVLLLAATRFHSYGLWQKGFILYFLLAANVQHHRLTHGPRTAKRAKAGGRRGGWVPRRRVVHVLDAERSWARRRCQPASS